MLPATARITAEIDRLERSRERALAAARDCTHARTAESAPRCYSNSVAEPPHDENRAAHGNIEVTEMCQRCGAERLLLINGRHREVSGWHAATAEIDEQLSDARQRRTAEQQIDAIERAAWRGDVLTVPGATPVQVLIVPYRDCDQVALILDGVRGVYSLAQIEATATARHLDGAQRTAWALIARRARAAVGRAA